MIRLTKKAVALLLVAMMTIASLVGCAKEKKVELDESAVVMTIGDTKVTAGMVNFYLRYQQSLMESLYASFSDDNFWTQDMGDGVTYEDNVKQAILEELQELYLVAAHAGEYEVTLTEEELAAIEAVAEKFEGANTDAAKEKASATKAYAVEYLKMYTLRIKLQEALKDVVNTDELVEQAKQKRIRYATYDATGKTDEEKAQVKAEAEAFLKAAKANGSMEAYATEAGITTTTQTFDADSTVMDATIIEKANALEVNAFADVIEVENVFYVFN